MGDTFGCVLGQQGDGMFIFVVDDGVCLFFAFYCLDSVRENEQCELNSQNLYGLQLDSKVSMPAN